MVVVGNVIIAVLGVVATAFAGDACGSSPAPTIAPTSAPQPVGTPCTFKDETELFLTANNGKRLNACNDCITAGDPSVMVASSDASIWKLQELANGRYTIRSNNILTKNIGPSLSRAPGVIDPNQVVFGYDLSAQSNVTEWTCREIGDKKITLQNAYTGGYLSRCEGCQPSAQTAPSDFEPAFALAMPHGNQGLASQQWSYTYF